MDDTRGVIAALKAKFPDLTGPDVNDICYATQNRQTAVRDLARVSDLILVVGAKNSSNSNRLVEIGLEMGVESHLVADGSEVDPAWVAGHSVVGLTAGASAPEELILSVIAALRRLDAEVEVTQMNGISENIELRLPGPLRPEARTADRPTADSVPDDAEELDERTLADADA